jgi:hypothetical protein
MTLGIFILFLMATVAGTYCAMALVANRSQGGSRAADTERMMPAILIVTVFVAALITRPNAFGVDTLTYLRMYDQFCFARIDKLELSYTVTFSLLNISQAGSCNSALLTMSWVLLILICFMLLPETFNTRLKLAALGLFSLIGTELATNALRQGISASVMMLALAWYRRNRMLGLALAVFAIALHASTGLVFVAVVVASLRFRYFALALVALIVLVLSYSYLGLDIEALNRLTGEIDKYSAHDADDLYVRILAAAQLFVPIGVAVVTKGWVDQQSGEERADLSMALKIALTALPYLTLPYFGYRYVYGVYLLVLYLSRRAILDDRRPAFELVLLANAGIALVWALGSSYLGQVPFLVL